MRIGLLTNLTAGRHERRLRRVLDAVAEHPHVEHVRTTSVIAVPDALARLARRDVELLIVNGGDGTLQNALTSIFRDGAFDGRTPLLAPLRGGRTNLPSRVSWMILCATSLGIRVSLPQLFVYGTADRYSFPREKDNANCCF